MDALAKVISSWLNDPIRAKQLEAIAPLLESGIVSIGDPNGNMLQFDQTLSTTLFKTVHFVLGLLQTAERMSKDAGYDQEINNAKNN